WWISTSSRPATTTRVMLSSANASAGPRSKRPSPAARASTAAPLGAGSLTTASLAPPAGPPGRGDTGGPTAGGRSQLLFDPGHAELGLHDALDVLGDLRQRHAAHHLVEEARHEEVLGDLGREAAAHEVEALVLRHRAGGGAVRALDVVGGDLELRDRDGLGLAVEEQVAVRLVG